LAKYYNLAFSVCNRSVWNSVRRVAEYQMILCFTAKVFPWKFWWRTWYGVPLDGVQRMVSVESDCQE
jgi:hypothetical protein